MNHATPNSTFARGSERKVLNVNLGLPTNDDLDLAIGLANVVELDALFDGCPRACWEFPGTGTNGSSILDVAFAFANGELLVGGGKVSVEFTLAVLAPHDTGRPASIVVVASSAGFGHRVVISSVQARKLAGQNKVEAVRELDLIGDACFLGILDTDIPASLEDESRDTRVV